MRFGCDGRDAATIYFDLHQRTLRYEVYFLPDPPAEPSASCTGGCCGATTMYGARFSLGPDGDVYLAGRVALEHLTEQELDRIIGVLFELIEHVVPARGRASRSAATGRPPAGGRRNRPVPSDLRDRVRLCQTVPRSAPTGAGRVRPEVQEVRFVRGSAKRSDRSSGPLAFAAADAPSTAPVAFAHGATGTLAA